MLENADPAQPRALLQASRSHCLLIVSPVLHGAGMQGWGGTKEGVENCTVCGSSPTATALRHPSDLFLVKGGNQSLDALLLPYPSREPSTSAQKAPAGTLPGGSDLLQRPQAALRVLHGEEGLQLSPAEQLLPHSPQPFSQNSITKTICSGDTLLLLASWLFRNPKHFFVLSLLLSPFPFTASLPCFH